MAKKKDRETEVLLNNLGKRLKELRKAKRYTYYELFAYDNGIPRAQYGRYERGQDSTFSSLYKLVKAFDMTLEEFFSSGFDNGIDLKLSFCSYFF